MSLVGGFFNWGVIAQYGPASAFLRNERLIGTWQQNYESYAILNRSYLVHDSWVTGKEGFDYTNINAWTLGQLDVPDLKPFYGVTGDTPMNVASNVNATPKLRIPASRGYGVTRT